MKHNDEETLLQSARAWDMEALASIYDTYSPLIYRYAMRLLGDPNLAEECTSETFARFLRALRNGGGPSKHLKAYLYRVAHNWITDYYRRHSFQQVELEPLANTLASEETPLEQQATLNEEQQRLRTALLKLTPEQRQVIVLRFLEEQSLQEVAETMQKPVGAVKSLQHRAVAALKRILQNED